MKIIFPILFFSVFFPSLGNSHDHSHKTDRSVLSNVGPGYAVLAADPEKGLKLSEIALKTIGVQTIPISEKGIENIPSDGLVREQTQTGVYRLRDGWFQFVPLSSSEFRVGDDIVVSGAALLRIAELDVFGEEEKDHHH